MSNDLTVPIQHRTPEDRLAYLLTKFGEAYHSWYVTEADSDERMRDAIEQLIHDELKQQCTAAVAAERERIADERDSDEALARAVEREQIIAMLQRRIAAMDDRKFKHGAEWAVGQIRGRRAAIARTVHPVAASQDEEQQP